MTEGKPARQVIPGASAIIVNDVSSIPVLRDQTLVVEDGKLIVEGGKGTSSDGRNTIMTHETQAIDLSNPAVDMVLIYLSHNKKEDQ